MQNLSILKCYHLSRIVAAEQITTRICLNEVQNDGSERDLENDACLFTAVFTLPRIF